MKIIYNVRMGDIAFLITSPHHLTKSPFLPKIILKRYFKTGIFCMFLYFIKYSNCRNVITKKNVFLLIKSSYQSMIFLLQLSVLVKKDKDVPQCDLSKFL